MAVVHFYTHETLERQEPTRGLGQRIRRWLVRMVSPTYGHCAIEDADGIQERQYDGFRTGVKMALAFALPRKFDNCASFVGRLLGVTARTPDDLFNKLTAKGER